MNNSKETSFEILIFLVNFIKRNIQSKSVMRGDTSGGGYMDYNKEKIIINICSETRLLLAMYLEFFYFFLLNYNFYHWKRMTD